MLVLLRGVLVDGTPLRRSREFRWLAIGQIISNLGSQAALVALPFQIFVVSHSATLVGLLGLFELGPMVVVSLIGGALLDRHDRRPMLVLAQGAMMTTLAALAALSLTTHRPPVLVVLILGGTLAGCSSLDMVSRSSIVPSVLGPELLRAGLSFNYGMAQATSIIGPGLGGLLIASIGVPDIYIADALSCVAMLGAALSLPPQRPTAGNGVPRVPVRRAILDGLSFIRDTRALAGAMLVDINAMMFGMPRALFAVLSLTVYHAGAGGTGLLYAAIAVGGTVSALTSAWVARVRWLGRAVVICVLVWGVAILGAGLVFSIWPAAILLMVAGWADGISAICRSTISQTLTPEHIRGRMSSVYSLSVAGGPRLGDAESGLAAGAFGALNAVTIGGAACLIGVGAVILAYPELMAYDADSAIAAMQAERSLVVRT